MSTGAEQNKTQARNRGHNQGKQDRKYTAEQHAAVKRVMRCGTTDYYEILNVTKTSSDDEIRKSYRRVSLAVHPDKNGAPSADEAFKRVARAFEVLGDETKKQIYDQTGSDPDARGGMGAAAANGFGGMNGGPGGRFAADDLFNMFFGNQFGNQFGGPFGGPFGQGGGQGFGFDGFGPRVYTFGGPNVRFGGAPRPGRQGVQPEQQNWRQMLPVLFILGVMFIISFLGNSGGKSSTGLRFQFEKHPPFVAERVTPNYRVPYYVRPSDLEKATAARLRRLDREAETRFVSLLRTECTREYEEQLDMFSQAQGWFSRDEELYEAAKNLPMAHCRHLDQLGVPRG